MKLVYNGEIIVEGVKAILTRNLEEIYEAINNGIIPVYIDGKGEIINSIKPIAIIDSILAKKKSWNYKGYGSDDNRYRSWI